MVLVSGLGVNILLKKMNRTEAKRAKDEYRLQTQT
jgi:hypothetical protein